MLTTKNACGLAGTLICCVGVILISTRWPLVAAFTTPEQVQAAKSVRDALVNRSANWRGALSSWTCPTDPASSDVPCDICSSDWSGNWEHLHCRGFLGPYGEGSVGEKDGLITTAHITDVNLDGPVARQFCQLSTLREFDLDGGQATGPFPRWFMEPYPVSSAGIANHTLCLAHVQELDLSSNRLTGTIPPEIVLKTTLQEFKVEHNYMTGTLPSVFVQLPSLYRLRVQHNRMHGTVPMIYRTFKNLNEIWLDNNDFSGDLMGLAGLKLMYALVHNNPKLCGMVPGSVRWASGYNPAGTRLGQPC